MNTNEQIIPPASEMMHGGEGFELGKYVGMPRQDYDAVRAVSGSMLKSWVAGKSKPLGRSLIARNALHHRLESKEVFERTYTVIDDVDLTTKDGKKFLADSERETGKTAIRKKELAHVADMFKALAGDVVGRAYIECQAEREVAVFGYIGSENSSILPKHPTLMKGIVDLLATHIWDLKTTGWPTMAEFANNIVNYNYHVQSALYRELVAGVSNGEYKQCKWLCLMARPPHHVWVKEPDNFTLSTGLHWLNSILNLYERWPERTKCNEDE